MLRCVAGRRGGWAFEALRRKASCMSDTTAKLVAAACESGRDLGGEQCGSTLAHFRVHR
jgi:hypothetical protein